MQLAGLKGRPCSADPSGPAPQSGIRVAARKNRTSVSPAMIERDVEPVLNAEEAIEVHPDVLVQAIVRPPVPEQPRD